MFLTCRFSSLSPYFMLNRAGSCRLLSSSESCSSPALLQEGCFFSSLRRVSCSCVLFLLWVMWLEHPASCSQPWLLCEVNICRCLNPSQGLNTFVGTWGKAPDLRILLRLLPQDVSADPFFLCLFGLMKDDWLLLHLGVLGICEPFGILLVVFPPLCLLAAFPGALPAPCSLWPSLCWSPSLCLNHFPPHYCNSLLAASVNLCCTDSQGCCLLPLPSNQCPQVLAGLWIALLAVRLALSLAYSAVTFFPPHPTLLTPSLSFLWADRLNF